jgi:hypothetical protein
MEKNLLFTKVAVVSDCEVRDQVELLSAIEFGAVGLIGRLETSRVCPSKNKYFYITGGILSVSDVTAFIAENW